MLKNKHKLLELKTSSLVDSLFIWNYKTNKNWRWIEFSTYKEYDFSDNVKNIDFVKSDKEWKILVKLYEEERELSIYFIVDINETFSNSWLWFDKKDIVFEILYLIWLSGIKSGDKIWAFIFDENNYKINIAKKWKQNFVNIVNIVDNFIENKNINKWIFNNIISNILDKYYMVEKKIKSKNKLENLNINNIKKWINYFNSLKIKNSLVFYITDTLNIDSKELKILCVKNDLVFCNIFNSFENDLNWFWISWFNEWNQNLFLDLDNKKKINEYIDLRIWKINDLKKFILKNWWKYILLDETKNIYKEFYNIFK